MEDIVRSDAGVSHLVIFPEDHRSLNDSLESPDTKLSASRLRAEAKDGRRKYVAPLPKSCQPPKHPLLRLAFQFLCMVAVSQMSLDHWEDTKRKEWKKHVKVMVGRFHYSNVTVSFIPHASGDYE